MENKCAICGTEENIVPRSKENFDFYNLCDKHVQYRNCFQLDKIKLTLGYLEKLPDAICCICDKQLSAEELDSIDKKDFTKTCNEHRWMSKFFAYNEFRKQYLLGQPFIHNGIEYSKDNPFGLR